jgi:hypothetical protein
MLYTHFYRCPNCPVRFQISYDYATVVWNPELVNYERSMVALDYEIHKTMHILEASCKAHYRR